MNVDLASNMTSLAEAGPTPNGTMRGLGSSDRSADQRFAAVLDRRFAAAGDDEDPVRSAAEQLVAQGLIMPMLKMARENPLRSEMFHGGAGERTFGPQLDQHLAQHIVQRAAPAIVDTVYQTLNKTVSRGEGVETHA